MTWTDKAILTLILVGNVVVACSPPVVNVQPDQSAICDALKPAMPVQYHSATTDADTVKRIQQANARYQAACK